MARKSIFDLMQEGNTRNNDVSRIVRYIEREYVVYVGATHYTLKKFVAAYCFPVWESKGHCIDVDDFFKTIKYERLVEEARRNTEAFFTLLEVAINFWKMTEIELNREKTNAKAYCAFDNAGEFFMDCLAQYNYTAVYYEDEERALVVEDKREVTAVAEIVEPQLAKSVLRYNHRSLKGDIEAKKSILLSMAADLEPRRGAMAKNDKDNEDLIFFMLNNMNLRHNNVTEGDSKYKEGVALMPEEELESWYDELYQMMLLAFLQLDNKERIERVKELKKQICSK